MPKKLRCVKDMDYDEFRDYFSRDICDTIITKGFSGVRTAVDSLIYSTLYNEVFGGKKVEPKRTNK